MVDSRSIQLLALLCEGFLDFHRALVIFRCSFARESANELNQSLLCRCTRLEASRILE